MALTSADIELINADDLALARKYIIGEDEVKRISINILVDTGTYYLCINESIQQVLQLPFIEKRKAQLANGQVEEYDIVGPIELKFENRRCHVDAMVLQGDNEPLLGAIPMARALVKELDSSQVFWPELFVTGVTSPTQYGNISQEFNLYFTNEQYRLYLQNAKQRQNDLKN
jgi:hypothetical protein